MKTPTAQPTQRPAPRKLTLTKETLRRLTSTELRAAAGGAQPGPVTCPHTLFSLFCR